MLRLILTSVLLSAVSRSALAGDRTPAALGEEAVGSHPSLEAARAMERAVQHRAAVAGAWSDPMLSFELSNLPANSVRLSDHPMAGVQLRAQQVVRPPGWSRTRRKVGLIGAEVIGHQIAEAQLGLRARVERAWWQLARSRLLRTVTDSHLARTEDLLAAARVRYETGTVGQHAVLRLEVLRAQLTDELGDFSRSDQELTAVLSEAIGRQDTFPTPGVIDALRPPAKGDWAGVARSHRPLVAELVAEGRAAQEAVRLARVGALPDLTVWVGYRLRTIDTASDPGTDLVSAGVGIPIPAGSSRRLAGERRAWLEESHASEAAAEATVREVEAEMLMISARWARAWEKAKTYDTGLIPGAQATLETTQGDFSVGRADFSSLFEAEVALLDLERARISAAVETHIQQTEALRVLGIIPSGEE